MEKVLLLVIEREYSYSQEFLGRSIQSYEEGHMILLNSIFHYTSAPTLSPEKTVCGDTCVDASQVHFEP